MKSRMNAQKIAVVLTAFSMLNAVSMLSAARADVEYTTVISTKMSGAMKPMTTSTTLLKEGLERVDSKVDMGMFKQSEGVVTNVPRREYTHIDTALKIYVVEPFGSGGKSAISSTRSASSTPKPALNKTKKSHLVLTVGAQFLGTVKMLKLDARHYKTSMRMTVTGDCGNSDNSMKAENWMADVKLPTLRIPGDGSENFGGFTAPESDGCAVTIENKGDTKGFEAAQKGLALKSIFFDTKGNPTMQSEITMLSFAVLKDSEFAPPADFKKMTRDAYDKARQKAMMGAFSPGAMQEMMKNQGDSSDDSNSDSSDDSSKTDSTDETPEVAPTVAPAVAPTPISSTRYKPVALKNDEKLDKALLDASKNAKDEDAIALLQNGANPNVSDKSGTTPLMLAAQNGKTELVSALLDMNASPNAVNKKGQSALHFATMIGQPKPKKKKFGGLGGLFGGAVLGDAISGGNLGSFSSMLGTSGLDNFLGNNLSDLLNGGAFNLGGKSGWMAVIGTAMQGDIQSEGTFGVQRLLSNGNLDAPGWIGLAGAVKNSNPDVLRAMSNVGGAENAQWSHFVNAASTGDVKTVKSLMSDTKMKPLLAQAQQGFLAASGEVPSNAAGNIVQKLLQKGATANLADSDGKTASQLFQARSWNDAAALLQK